MEVDYDPAKNQANIAKHGVSLADAALLDVGALTRDRRSDYGEDRYTAFGTIDGRAYCLVFTFRSEVVRAISLRRVHTKEYRRHVV